MERLISLHGTVATGIIGRPDHEVNVKASLWMRSCKQITTEALEVIASTWTFEGSSSTISKRPAEKAENDKPNPIVFHCNVMRNIAVRENLNTNSVDNKTVRVGRHLDIQEPIQILLGLLKHLNVQNVCLDLEWSRWWHRSDESDPFWHAPEWVDNEPEIYTEDWDDWWDARFRKVKIVINLSMDPSGGGAGADLVGVAESCAKRLVGQDNKTSFQNSSFKTRNPAGTIWRKNVTVERKLEVHLRN
jgi:hypothetical protein